MRIPVKLIPIALFLLLSITFGFWLDGTPRARATVSSFISSSLTVPSAGLVSLELRGNDDSVGNASITVTTSAGTLTPFGCVVDPTPTTSNCAGGASPTPAASLTYNSALFDGDALEDPYLITMRFTAPTCTNTTITITASQDSNGDGDTADADETQTLTITCGTTTGGGGSGTASDRVTVSASPNALTCGGTTTITAALRGATPATTPPVFHFQTDAGLLRTDSINTAVLALLPGSGNATVTVSTIADPDGGAVEFISVQGQIVITNFCGTSGNIATIAVVATPNVIPCGGTATLTATARSNAGVIIPGVGFNWFTDVGGLIVGPPNNASSTAGTATLTLQPGMTESVVIARVGGAEGSVRVQQFCPQVLTDPSTAAGKIVLVPSSTSITCNGNTFIGAIVKDSKGQVPLNVEGEPAGGGTGLEVTFIATSGRFSGASLSNAGSSSVTTSATPAPGSTPTNGNGTTTTTTTTGPFVAKVLKNGTLNVIYNADPGTNGQVTITAAAGAAFGSTTVTVNCPTAGAAGAFGATASVFGGGLRPPSTGEGIIRPPNTGDAGLAGASAGRAAGLTSLVALCAAAAALTASLLMHKRRA